MAMGISVKLPSDFDLQGQTAASEWKCWKTCFEDYLLATGQDQSADKIKLSILRNIIGTESVKIMSTFAIPEDETNKYDLMMSLIDKYVNPRMNESFERYNFITRVQKEGESFEQFLTSCRHLIRTCNYNEIDPEQTAEDKALKDKILMSIRDSVTREALLRVDKLTLQKAIEFCRTSEQSKNQNLKFHNETKDVDIGQVHKERNKDKFQGHRNYNNSKSKTNTNEKFKCKRCQLTHGARECPAYGKKFKRINNVESCGTLELAERNKFINLNPDVFRGHGKLYGKHRIITVDNFEPVSYPPINVPVAIRDKLRDELDRLTKRGAIVKVNEIDPRASINRIVIVNKQNGKLRLCLDPSDLNKQIVRKPRIVHKLEDVCAQMMGKKIFSVFDLSEGYHHLELDEASTWKCCFATSYGIFRYKVLPYGLSNSQDLFQEVVEDKFKGIENLLICHDDMIVMGTTKKEHDTIVKKVLERAKEVGAKFNSDKFQYCQEEVKFMGQVFSHKGMQIDPDRVESLCKLKEPNSKIELQRILGAFNYVRRYIPNMAEHIQPLCQLLKNNIEWVWLPSHLKCFDNLKDIICKSPALVPYDPNYSYSSVLQLRITANKLEPTIQKQVYENLCREKEKLQLHYDKTLRRKPVEFRKGDSVVIRSSKDNYWLKAIVLEKANEPRSYWVRKEGNNRIIRRNSQQMKHSCTRTPELYPDIQSQSVHKDTISSHVNDSVNKIIGCPSPNVKSVSMLSHNVNPNIETTSNSYKTRVGRNIKTPYRYRS
ncbi:uncharacterized protein [Diabrotica undecimpunctata]|uniref:uncharacterized protein n=1 Tax=Diabrotica undecimpunctata TaxID=50387 RepID=UPI003B642831